MHRLRFSMLFALCLGMRWLIKKEVLYKIAKEKVIYVNDKVFKLNTYDRLDDTKLYARMSEKNENTETYIVKFDNNKMQRMRCRNCNRYK